MSTITLNSELDFTSSPLVILSNTTVLIGISFSITNVNNYLQLNGSNITINGQSNTLTINVGSYQGFVQNNNTSNTNIIIQNLSVNSSSNNLANCGGWICQQGFCNGIISFCNSNGLIPENGGGIIGMQSYNCTLSNCFSTGLISTYAGGICGSYTQSCNVSNSYSTGLIGSYAGGIFGFGTNYNFDSITYSPTSPLDQSGNLLNNVLSNPSYSLSTTTSTVTACYSIGSIGNYAGGIFGYFAYNCSSSNCYTVGMGSGVLSGGIFAPNFYYSSPIYYPATTNCSASNCYIVGGNLSGNGIFAYSSTNITSNITTNCFVEQFETCRYSWSDNNAKRVLRNDLGSVWIDINLVSCNIPWLLASFVKQFYNPTNLDICWKCANSNVGTLSPYYSIVNVNNCPAPCNITINNQTGQLYFYKLKRGCYRIKILNGTQLALNFTSCGIPAYTYTNYYFTTYYANSYYDKKKKCKKCKKCCTNNCTNSCYLNNCMY